MGRFTVAISFVVALFVCGCSSDEENSTDIAQTEAHCEAVASNWLALVDSGQHEESWDRAAEPIKQEITKDLVLCEDCGCVVAPADQIRWVAKKLGPLAFSNTSVWVFNLQAKSLSDRIQTLTPKKESEIQRSDRLKVLCPKCRRKVVLKS